MKYFRFTFLIIIIFAGITIITGLIIKRSNTPLNSTLAPFFQLVGEPIKAVDVATARVLPIDENDEKIYGEKLASYYDQRANKSDSVYLYINNLLNVISSYSNKPFKYKAYIMSWSIPNACAMPGGIILVTEGLLKTLSTEGELLSVLAHEMGHIECGHCFTSCKYEILSNKIDLEGIGEIADFFNALFFRHSFSKTQEAEADAYAYKIILKSSYTPSSVAGSFKELLKYSQNRGEHSSSEQDADLFRDYFMSHPPLALRIAKYEAESNLWWKRNTNVLKYVGRKNIKMKKTLKELEIKEEWVTSSLY